MEAGKTHESVLDEAGALGCNFDDLGLNVTILSKQSQKETRNLFAGGKREKHLPQSECSHQDDRSSSEEAVQEVLNTHLNLDSSSLSSIEHKDEKSINNIKPQDAGSEVVNNQATQGGLIGNYEVNQQKDANKRDQQTKSLQSMVQQFMESQNIEMYVAQTNKTISGSENPMHETNPELQLEQCLNRANKTQVKIALMHSGSKATPNLEQTSLHYDYGSKVHHSTALKDQKIYNTSKPIDTKQSSQMQPQFNYDYSITQMHSGTSMQHPSSASQNTNNAGNYVKEFRGNTHDSGKVSRINESVPPGLQIQNELDEQIAKLTSEINNMGKFHRRAGSLPTSNYIPVSPRMGYANRHNFRSGYGQVDQDINSSLPRFFQPTQSSTLKVHTSVREASASLLSPKSGTSSRSRSPSSISPKLWATSQDAEIVVPNSSPRFKSTQGLNRDINKFGSIQQPLAERISNITVDEMTRSQTQLDDMHIIQLGDTSMYANRKGSKFQQASGKSEQNFGHWDLQNLGQNKRKSQREGQQENQYANQSKALLQYVPCIDTRNGYVFLLPTQDGIDSREALDGQQMQNRPVAYFLEQAQQVGSTLRQTMMHSQHDKQNNQFGSESCSYYYKQSTILQKDQLFASIVGDLKLLQNKNQKYGASVEKFYKQNQINQVDVGQLIALEYLNKQYSNQLQRRQRSLFQESDTRQSILTLFDTLNIDLSISCILRIALTLFQYSNRYGVNSDFDAVQPQKFLQNHSSPNSLSGSYKIRRSSLPNLSSLSFSQTQIQQELNPKAEALKFQDQVGLNKLHSNISTFLGKIPTVHGFGAEQSESTVYFECIDQSINMSQQSNISTDQQGSLPNSPRNPSPLGVKQVNTYTDKSLVQSSQSNPMKKAFLGSNETDKMQLVLKSQGLYKFFSSSYWIATMGVQNCSKLYIDDICEGAIQKVSGQWGGVLSKLFDTSRTYKSDVVGCKSRIESQSVYVETSQNLKDAKESWGNNYSQSLKFDDIIPVGPMNDFEGTFLEKQTSMQLIQCLQAATTSLQDSMHRNIVVSNNQEEDFVSQKEPQFINSIGGNNQTNKCSIDSSQIGRQQQPIQSKSKKQSYIFSETQDYGHGTSQVPNQQNHTKHLTPHKPPQSPQSRIQFAGSRRIAQLAQPKYSVGVEQEPQQSMRIKHRRSKSAVHVSRQHQHSVVPWGAGSGHQGDRVAGLKNSVWKNLNDRERESGSNIRAVGSGTMHRGQSMNEYIPNAQRESEAESMKSTNYLSFPQQNVQEAQAGEGLQRSSVVSNTDFEHLGQSLLSIAGQLKASQQYKTRKRDSTKDLVDAVQTLGSLLQRQAALSQNQDTFDRLSRSQTKSYKAKITQSSNLHPQQAIQYPTNDRQKVLILPSTQVQKRSNTGLSEQVRPRSQSARRYQEKSLTTGPMLFQPESTAYGANTMQESLPRYMQAHTASSQAKLKSAQAEGSQRTLSPQNKMQQQGQGTTRRGSSPPRLKNSKKSSFVAPQLDAHNQRGLQFAQLDSMHPNIENSSLSASPNSSGRIPGHRRSKGNQSEFWTQRMLGEKLAPKHGPSQSMISIGELLGGFGKSAQAMSTNKSKSQSAECTQLNGPTESTNTENQLDQPVPLHTYKQFTSLFNLPQSPQSLTEEPSHCVLDVHRSAALQLMEPSDSFINPASSKSQQAGGVWVHTQPIRHTAELEEPEGQGPILEGTQQMQHQSLAPQDTGAEPKELPQSATQSHDGGEVLTSIAEGKLRLRSNESINIVLLDSGYKSNDTLANQGAVQSKDAKVSDMQNGVGAVQQQGSKVNEQISQGGVEQDADSLKEKRKIKKSQSIFEQKLLQKYLKSLDGWRQSKDGDAQRRNSPGDVLSYMLYGKKNQLTPLHKSPLAQSNTDTYDVLGVQQIPEKVPENQVATRDIQSEAQNGV